MAVTEKQIAEWRALRGKGMVSAVGEYTPDEFWDALDEIERFRAALEWISDNGLTAPGICGKRLGRH